MTKDRVRTALLANVVLNQLAHDGPLLFSEGVIYEFRFQPGFAHRPDVAQPPACAWRVIPHECCMRNAAKPRANQMLHYFQSTCKQIHPDRISILTAVG